MRRPRVTSNRLREKTWRKFLAGIDLLKLDFDYGQELGDLLREPSTNMESGKLVSLRERIISAMEATQ